MSWREQMRPASFRGVEFHVVSAGATVGRRVALHEYPFRDTPYVEDLGRRARTMRVEAVIVGDDYMVRRDALIAAIEQAGPGKLVHPYYGELTVSVDAGGAQIDESNTQGGLARITFAVVESGEAKFPAASIATQDVVDQRAATTADTLKSSFGDSFSIEGLPGYAVDSAASVVDGALDTIESIVSVLPGASAGRGSVLGLIVSLRPELASMLAQPLQLVGRVQDIYSAVRQALAPQVATKALAKLGTYGSNDHLPAATPTRRREADNRDLLIELIRGSAVIERARAASQTEFTDYNSAVAVRDSVVEQIDLVANAATSDELFQTLSALRAAVVKDIGARGADLARIVSVSLPDSVPAIALAYDLYEDPSRDAEIVARNAVQHPGFLPASQPLEVLSDL